jgi:hypothetical protein
MKRFVGGERGTGPSPRRARRRLPGRRRCTYATVGPAFVLISQGAGRFRPITWDEWFENFERHHLTFVYEEEIADRAYAVWEARGGRHGQDRDDWFEAERQMLRSGARPMSWYHIMTVETISARPS